jgi:hypothetical protein
MAGIKEAGAGVGNVDKNAKFVTFETFNGGKIKPGEKTGRDGDIGLLIVFRTKEFSEEARVESLAAESNLNVAGSGAVAAK